MQCLRQGKAQHGAEEPFADRVDQDAQRHLDDILLHIWNWQK
jgi:hypothetical protein